MDGEDVHMDIQMEDKQEYMTGVEEEGGLLEPEEDYVEPNMLQEVSEADWRQLAKIVRDVGPTLSPDEELGDLVAAEIAVEEKDQQRVAEHGRLQDEIRTLKRIYSQAAAAAKRPAGIPSETEHHMAVNELEQQQYQVTKSLNEEQSTVCKKEVELVRLRGEKEDTSRWEVGEEQWHDAQVLKVKLMSDLGFSLLPTAQNEPIKLVVRNDSKSDMHPVTIDSSRAKSTYANLLWSLAGE